MRLFLLCLLSLAYYFTATAPALASGEAHPLPWANFVYRILTLIGFIAIIWYFGGEKIKTFFQGRTQALSDELKSLEQQKVNAQQSLQDVETRIANLEKERLAILEDYKAQGEAIRAEIIAQAERTAEQINLQAQKSAKNELDAAIAAILSELAEKTSESTEQLILQRLTAEDHSKLIDKYLTKVVLN